MKELKIQLIGLIKITKIVENNLIFDSNIFYYNYWLINSQLLLYR